VAIDAVAGSSTSRWVPGMWVLAQLYD